MEMTIEEHIEQLKQLPIHSEVSTDYFKKIGKTVDFAIEIMRKYQKIKEIVTNNDLEWGNTSVRANALWEVKKVIEDGNDD